LTLVYMVSLIPSGLLFINNLSPRVCYLSL